jgi:transposase
MNYVGIDIHKKYSVLCAQDEAGQKLKEGRIEGSGEGLVEFFGELEGPSKAVLEACWNWGLTHDRLEEIEGIEEVVLAHPLKTRLIADAQIKTDRLDAYALGTLLRGNLVARAHIPATRNPGAQEPAPATALLVAPAHDAAQSHSRLIGSAA